MENKEYKKLGKKYGKGIYELFTYFKSVKIYTYEGDGEYTYEKTIIGYLNNEKEVMDIRTGEKFPASNLSLNLIPEINALCYRIQDVYSIDAQLFEKEEEKDVIGASTTTYDIHFFGEIIRYMHNFVITTDGFTKLDYFQPIRLTEQEIDERKKRQLLNEKGNLFSKIRCAKLCGVKSMEGPMDGKRRKSKICWYNAEPHVPIYFDSDTQVAIDLRDGTTEYELLEFVPKKKSVFSKLSKHTDVELSDAQYDRIIKDMKDFKTHKYIENFHAITWFEPKYFTYQQLKEIVYQYEKLMRELMLKQPTNSSYQYKK